MNQYDEQFNLRKRHPFGRFHMLCNEMQSAWTRLTQSNTQHISYGNTTGQQLDIFPSKQPNSPVYLFIHGGYFRALDKRQYSYLTKPLVTAGHTVVLINYDLAPSVTVAEIIEQIRKAFIWIYQNINQWNGNPNQIIISGHSVGAFLVAKLLETQWSHFGITSSIIKGAVMLSGLYDLEPMRQSFLNQALKLSVEDAKELSPINCQLHNSPPILMAVGKQETAEFIKQSQDYSNKLQADGYSHELLQLEGKNHYTVSRMLSKQNNPLMKKILSIESL